MQTTTAVTAQIAQVNLNIASATLALSAAAPAGIARGASLAPIMAGRSI
jgi:hypothetical protein